MGNKSKRKEIFCDEIISLKDHFGTRILSRNQLKNTHVIKKNTFFLFTYLDDDAKKGKSMGCGISL